ncbi:MAG: sulfotransferase [Rhodanobacteraceae bacterium]|nr:sulfotransferase [Rhodanobacteraceae bacterium]
MRNSCIWFATREACFSTVRTLFSEACGYSYQQGELADYYLGYRKLMEHWHRVLPGRILDVDFVRLTNDTEAVAKEVFDYCGLSFVAEALNTEKTRGVVATASSAQVRRKISAHTVPAWSHYRQQLEPLLSRLALLGNSQGDRGG